MKIEDFDFLKELTTNGVIVLTSDKNFAEEIYTSNIPFRPGVYLVYSLNTEGQDKDLLYFGKAGVTNYSNKPVLNFHQLPKRLLATTKIPNEHPEYNRNSKKDITRAKLWSWYVNNKYKHGFKIYWFITEWPSQNPNDFEKKIKSQLKIKYPKWEKTI
jgi:hypothetical protein